MRAFKIEEIDRVMTSSHKPHRLQAALDRLETKYIAEYKATKVGFNILPGPAKQARVKPPKQGRPGGPSERNKRMVNFVRLKFGLAAL